MTAKSLDPAKIEETVKSLYGRIHERFPGSGLSGVCTDLIEVARNSGRKSIWFAKPILPLRIGVGFLIVLLCSVVIVGAFRWVYMSEYKLDFPLFVQVMEAGINDAIFVGITIFFLATLETRIKRHQALKSIHELRALAHIIDLHQLTKDPDQTFLETHKTHSSPDRRMSAFELSRYLDYCSEMLSLVGKIAALYVQNFDDPVVLASVNDVESLTAGFSDKIWQKIIIINSIKQQNGV